jgi:endonuclease/exonuclease/phosphatase family metal-dependent hydrolase
VWVVNTHLDHADASTRAAQARKIIEWLDGGGSASGSGSTGSGSSSGSGLINGGGSSGINGGVEVAGAVVAGDLNATAADDGALREAFAAAGFRSAYAVRVLVFCFVASVVGLGWPRRWYCCRLF